MVNTDSFIEEATEEIQETVGDANAIIALSGGVDSSVAAALAYRAIGDQLTPVYVDTGLMRKGETEGIRETFDYMESLRVVEAQDRFLGALEGVIDPEEKRKVIGEQFIREFEREAKDTDADYLVQGTIYPDRIESEGNIKSHHNVGGLPDVVDFEGIVEPVRDLYKDEVREVARELGLESVVSERMPFPGPGLAVRIVGEVTEEKVEVARHACHVVEEELEEYDPWQAFAAVIGKGTGVKGDNRVHGWIVSVRSVESRDGMTARAQELSWETLQRIQSRITGQNDNVARVVYDVTHKPPATIEYE
ncbi:glutamine-hydrolyzing GMP synthase subunit GuaA [Halogeometricum borinquense]|uniref:GMP synthase [glutamine-hydrolyzing] subunit B n=1 Tax=Halogeometricum borinquense TaxID=60847 RepID=A0A482TNC0_9EURY|nr:glutamine-hydrolyzing GMP synthase [Halogeometricum borinquense]QIB75131.1 glutamine-hydrolyzing GMP synthase subunit GuaA [Halogeometricum borinquense]QIQ75888.1 glutamine-hydrolyzing GMP synthase subunit GuaA [Halogeometricum borinquense]RYJ14405.1 glutamine-hydrolyzing GMP synthase subunit GuaA [Halogeometricum borinquense]